MNDWALFALYGFLIFIATVVAPVVRHIDTKRGTADRTQERETDKA